LIPFYLHTSSTILRSLGMTAKSAVGNKWCGVWMLNPPTSKYEKKPVTPTSVSLVE
jgi:hypothetical protein